MSVVSLSRGPKRSVLSVAGCGTRLQVLVYLSRNPVATSSALRNRIGVSQPAMDFVLKNLHKDKLVRRHVDDVRGAKYSLTKKGEKSLDRVRALLA